MCNLQLRFAPGAIQNLNGNREFEFDFFTCAAMTVMRLRMQFRFTMNPLFPRSSGHCNFRLPLPYDLLRCVHSSKISIGARVSAVALCTHRASERCSTDGVSRSADCGMAFVFCTQLQIVQICLLSSSFFFYRNCVCVASTVPTCAQQQESAAPTCTSGACTNKVRDFVAFAHSVGFEIHHALLVCILIFRMRIRASALSALQLIHRATRTCTARHHGMRCAFAPVCRM